MQRILVYGMSSTIGGIETYIANYFSHIDRTKLMMDFIVDDKAMAFQEEFIGFGSKVYFFPSRRRDLAGHLAKIRKIVREGNYHTVYFNILSSVEAVTMLALFGLKHVRIYVHSHNGNVKRIWLHKLCRPDLRV